MSVLFKTPFMIMEILSKEFNLQVNYNAREHYLYCNWIGFQNEEHIKHGGATILKILKEKKCSKVLNDNTLVSGPWQNAADWVSNIWFPAMAEAGLKHFAWIFSPNLFAELSAKKAMPTSGMVKSFNKIEEAQEWLINQ